MRFLHVPGYSHLIANPSDIRNALAERLQNMPGMARARLPGSTDQRETRQSGKMRMGSLRLRSINCQISLVVRGAVCSLSANSATPALNRGISVPAMNSNFTAEASNTRLVSEVGVRREKEVDEREEKRQQEAPVYQYHTILSRFSSYLPLTSIYGTLPVWLVLFPCLFSLSPHNYSIPVVSQPSADRFDCLCTSGHHTEDPHLCETFLHAICKEA
ncbi:hypothetical protein V8C44DRAFT_747 [Trichoderma aethiopicum]